MRQLQIKDPTNEETAMQTQNHDEIHGHHQAEDPQVCFTVGLIFVAVLAAIFLLAMFN
jgi:hypothetical protein